MYIYIYISWRVLHIGLDEMRRVESRFSKSGSGCPRTIPWTCRIATSRPRPGSGVDLFCPSVTNGGCMLVEFDVKGETTLYGSTIRVLGAWKGDCRGSPASLIPSVPTLPSGYVSSRLPPSPYCRQFAIKGEIHKDCIAHNSNCG